MSAAFAHSGVTMRGARLCILSLFFASASAANFELGAGLGAGVTSWSGWDGSSFAWSFGPRVSNRTVGLGLSLHSFSANVEKSAAKMSFSATGVLLKGNLSVVEAGFGYAGIPGFRSEQGTDYVGIGSLIVSLGLGIPIRLSDRFFLNLGIENVFVTSLASFLNPNAKLGLAYRFPPAVHERSQPPAPTQPHETPIAREQPKTETEPKLHGLPKPEPVRPRFPPRLETRVFFEEAGRKNNSLDAGEQAYVIATVTNTGRGAGRNLRVVGEPISSFSGVEIGAGITIESLLPGDSIRVRFGSNANEDVKDQELRIRFSVIEPVFGMDALPNVIKITTHKLEPPVLAVGDVAIEDGESEWAMGNGDKQLEAGEQVEVTNVLQNKGTGDALGVSVQIITNDENVLFQGERNPLTPGDIAAGDYRLLKYPILVNTKYKGGSVKLVLKTREQRDRFSTVDTVVIPLKTVLARPSEITITPRGSAPTTGVRTPPMLSDELLKSIPKGEPNPDAFAVVIGAAKYRGIADVEYARNDAEAMHRYLVDAFGFADGNVIVLDDPTIGDFNQYFGTASEPRGQLYNMIARKSGQYDVFIYYVGHGVPSLKDKRGYLVPSDANPDYIEMNGYPVEQLYANIGKLPARKVTIVLDACFSGETPDMTGKVGSLLKNASAGFVVVPLSKEAPKNAVVMTASSGAQVAAWYPEKKHSLFTYWLLRGLKGEADKNSDKSITLSELKQYLGDNVPPIARALYNREQTPEVHGNLDSEILKLK